MDNKADDQVLAKLLTEIYHDKKKLEDKIIDLTHTLNFEKERNVSMQESLNQARKAHDELKAKLNKNE